MSDLTGGTRRVSVTHDGKRIGHTEPLDPDRRGKVGIPKTTAGWAVRHAYVQRMFASRVRKGTIGSAARASIKRGAA